MSIIRCRINMCLLFLMLLGCIRLQAQDSVSYQNKKLSYSHPQLIAPVLLMGTSLIFSAGMKEGLTDAVSWKSLSDLPEHTDAALAFSPILVAYGLDLCGVPSRTDLINRTVILCKAEIMMVGGVYLLKNITKENRPDGSNFRSFPSSHTAQAFLAATFLSTEYKDKYPWMPYASYTVAATVGAMRIANNKHYINDVLFGAGFGILSQKISYWTHQYHWGKRSKRNVVKF